MFYKLLINSKLCNYILKLYKFNNNKYNYLQKNNKNSYISNYY